MTAPCVIKQGGADKAVTFWRQLQRAQRDQGKSISLQPQPAWPLHPCTATSWRLPETRRCTCVQINSTLILKSVHKNAEWIRSSCRTCSITRIFINVLCSALQQGTKCTQGKLCAFMDQNLGYVFSLSIQILQSKHPNILLAMHNLEVGVSALFATDITCTDHRKSCVAFYRGKKRTGKLIRVLCCFESQMLALFSEAQKVNIQDGPKPQHSTPNLNLPKVQRYEDPRFWFSDKAWPSCSVMCGSKYRFCSTSWMYQTCLEKAGNLPNKPHIKIFM